MEKGDAKLCDELLQASAGPGGMQGLELSRRTRLEFDGVFLKDGICMESTKLGGPFTMLASSFCHVMVS